MRNIFFIAIVTSVLVSCNVSSDISLRALFIEERSPESSVLPIDTDDIREPVLLASRDSILVCTNQMTKQVLRVYNLDSGAYRDLIYIGRAENELLNASAIWFSGDTLNVYSSNSGKILRIPSGELFDPHPEIRSIPFPLGYSGLTVFAGGSHYVAMNVLSDSPLQFLLLDSGGAEMIGFGNYPETGSQGHYRETRLVYQGKLAASPDEAHIAYASSFGNVFRFFDISDPSDISLVREYRFTEPEYISDSDLSEHRYSVIWEKTCHRGTLAMAAADNGCYFLCDDTKTVSDDDWRMNSVYCFDWEGNPLWKLDLGRRTQSIAYNRERHQLIALTVSEQDEYVFVAYSL